MNFAAFSIRPNTGADGRSAVSRMTSVPLIAGHSSLGLVMPRPKSIGTTGLPRAANQPISSSTGPEPRECGVATTTSRRLCRAADATRSEISLPGDAPQAPRNTENFRSPSPTASASAYAESL